MVDIAMDGDEWVVLVGNVVRARYSTRTIAKREARKIQLVIERGGYPERRTVDGIRVLPAKVGPTHFTHAEIRETVRAVCERR